MKLKKNKVLSSDVNQCERIIPNQSKISLLEKGEDERDVTIIINKCAKNVYWKLGNYFNEQC